MPSLPHLRTLATAAVAAFFLAACQTPPPAGQVSIPGKPAASAQPASTPASAPTVIYHPTTANSLPGWQDGELLPGFMAWRKGCARLVQRQPVWQDVCSKASELAPSEQDVRDFIARHLDIYQLGDSDGKRSGLITGYYEPVYPGSATRSSKAMVPVYGVPDDLISVSLDGLYPELKGKRLRGQLKGRQLVPYLDSAGIRNKGVNAPVLAWLEHPLDLQFLQVQGSGRIRLTGGGEIRVGYADQNGHPYAPVGRWLIRNGIVPASEMSMQRIRSWAEANPQRVDELLNSNPSYVFFRTLPASQDGPPGALGVPLTAGYSIAVDPAAIPLGSLAYLGTTRPDTRAPLNRLLAAQDTGGAIRGSVRADFFWGTGDQAGELAGIMKQDGEVWLFWPKAQPLPSL